MVRIVGILAALSLTACGVGADESYDELGVMQASQSLQQADYAGQAVAPTQVAAAQSSEVRAEPGTVALPQDPIPVRPGALNNLGYPVGPDLMWPTPTPTPPGPGAGR